MLQRIIFEPGINREQTPFATGAGYVDGNRVRFRKGLPEQIGGWQDKRLSVTFPAGEVDGEVTTTFRGVARKLLDWGTADQTLYLAAGTNLKLYVEFGGEMHDITPVRETTAAGDVTFAATNGSATITVTDTEHGAVAGDYVTFSGAVALGGLITADVLNHEYEIKSIIDGDSYTIDACETNQTPVVANASDTGGGGGSVVAAYQLNTGTNFFIPSAGYGTGPYGFGPYGGAGNLAFASQLRLWSLDAFADDLVACPRGGPPIYWVEASGVGTRAVSLSELPGASDAPEAALQVMVSPVDRHIICFGCNPIGSSEIDPLLVRWGDQESATDWTPTSINTAGGQVLSSGSQIIGAVKTRQEILVFTDSTLHAMRFVGSPFIFQFDVVAENVSLASPNAAISAGDAVYFMDIEGFYIYQGAAVRLPCTVLDYVYENLDVSQAYKIHAAHNPDDSEVTWYYPTSTGEIDSYVTYNYVEQHWCIGKLDRGAWIQAHTRTAPIASSVNLDDVKSQTLYDHEFGYTADGGDIGAYLESGRVAIGDGDSFQFVSRFLPDFRYQGNPGSVDIDVILKASNFPQEELTERARVNITATTRQGHVRVRAREIALRLEAKSNGYGWTMGHFRLDLRTDGRK